MERGQGQPPHPPPSTATPLQTHMGPRRKKKEAVLTKEKRRFEFRNLVALMLMRIGKPGI